MSALKTERFESEEDTQNMDFSRVDDAVSLLKAMANKHRLSILCLLKDNEQSVSDLNLKIPLSQSALSQHLAWLREHQLVQTRRDAKAIFYSLSSEQAKDIIHVLHTHYCSD